MNANRTGMSQLEENLYALATIAMIDTGAEGFSFTRVAGNGTAPEHRESFGVPVDEENVSNVLSFPLRLRGAVEGSMMFVYTSAAQLQAAQPRMARHVAAIGKLWSVQSLSHAYLTTLQRIIELEEALINSKISAVVHGALSEDRDTESADAVIRHVESVLRPSSTLRNLEEILAALTTEIQERSWIDRAKNVLNAASGMSEYEAHSHLRKISRRSRRPLADVAREIVLEAG